MDTFLLSASSFLNGLCCMLFFLEALWYLKRRNRHSFNKTVAITMFYWCLLFAKDPIYQIPSIADSVYLYKLFLLVDMTALFTCAFYSIELLNPLYVTKKNVLLHFLPYTMFVVLYAIFADPIIYDMAVYYMLAYCAAIFCYLVFLTKRYYHFVECHYSNLKPVNINWLWTAVTLFLFSLACWLYICYHISPFADAFYYLSILIVWGIVSYNSKRQHLALAEVRLLQKEEAPEGNKLEKYPAINFDKEIHELFVEKQIARNPHITMTEVVRMVGTNRNYFSYYLNARLHTTFYDFINGFRLQDAEAMLHDINCKLSLDEIAQTAGFNSLSTFRRAFVKKHGMTPHKFRKQSIEKHE